MPAISAAVVHAAVIAVRAVAAVITVPIAAVIAVPVTAISIGRHAHHAIPIAVRSAAAVRPAMKADATATGRQRDYGRRLIGE
jgi:hypothetical protein